MSADEKTYIEAKLEMLAELMPEIRAELKALNAKVDNLAIQQVAYSGRLALIEDEQRKNHCPRAGLCIELEKEVNDLKSRIGTYDSDKKAAFSIWKIIVTIGGFAVGLTATVWGVIEIIKNFIHKP